MHAPGPRLWFKQMLAEAPCRKCLHAHTQTHTHTHTHAHTHTHSHVHTHTRTHTHTLVQQNVPCLQCPEDTPLLGHNSKPIQPKHSSGNMLTRPLMPARTERRSCLCGGKYSAHNSLTLFIARIEGSQIRFGKRLNWFYPLNIKVNPFTHATHMVAATCGPYLWTVLMGDHSMKAEATEKGVGGMA